MFLGHAHVYLRHARIWKNKRPFDGAQKTLILSSAACILTLHLELILTDLWQSQGMLISAKYLVAYCITSDIQNTYYHTENLVVGVHYLLQSWKQNEQAVLDQKL